MTPHDYLVGVLQQQALSAQHVSTLRAQRETIENWLRGRFGGGPRFYYAGSFGKQTMIRAAYDLDIVIYFPSTERATLHDLYWGIHRRLVDGSYQVVPRTVALRLPYNGPFHIDIVPGRAQDHTFRYATLYKNQPDPSTLQTSLKVHIEAVKDAGLSDLVRLMKLWRLRQNLSISTFALEIVVARAMYNVTRSDLAACMLTVFRWIDANLEEARLQDPANTNNIVDVPPADRFTAARAARNALEAPSWGQII
ncbi:MAG TPA: hypothetical protein VEA69_14875 [Tepidisphaeraceae bacterium]|nr:hypothetical protein [Tepidisphaeraceae bacterium]